MGAGGGDQKWRTLALMWNDAFAAVICLDAARPPWDAGERAGRASILLRVSRSAVAKALPGDLHRRPQV